MVTDSRIGSDLAGYRIEGILGRGGMSVVYLAQHLRLDRRVALKVLAPDLAEDERFRERFIRESRIAAGIEHPNIIPVYEAGEADGVLFIAMRYVRGTDLKSLIRSEGRLEPARAIHMLAQVGSALDVAHEDGLVHRDVKPGNILIAPGTDKAPREHVYLSDFGLTKRSSSDSGITATGQFVGTLDYAAPEQFEGGSLDGRTDVYSLGCVLYECLTGAVPFQRDQDAAMMFAHLLSPPPKATEANPELPVGIDPVIATAMAKKPEDRYQSAGALVEGASSALGVSTSQLSGPLPSMPRRRPRWLLPAGAAVLAAVIAVVAVLASRGGGTPTPGPSSHPNTGPLAIATDAVARIDPRRFVLSRVVSLPGTPTAITAADGAIWAAEQSGTVSKVDPSTGRAITIGVGGSPTALTAATGVIWAFTATDGPIAPIATAAGSVGKAIELPTGTFRGIAVGYRALWLAGTEGNLAQGHPVVPGLFRIDPDTGAIALYVQFAVSDASVVVGEGSVWVNDGSGGVERVSPQAAGNISRIELPERVVGPVSNPIAVGRGGVWAATQTLIYHIDAATGQVLRRITLPGTAMGVALTTGRVWVACGNGTVTVIDAGTDTIVRTIRVGGLPVGITVSPDGGLWVAAQGS